MVSASAAVYDRSIDRWSLLRVLDPFGAGELAELIIAGRRATISLHGLPRLHQRLRIVHRDPILEDAVLDKPNPLVHRHLIAVRAEPLDVGVVAQRHRIDDERVA